MWSENDHQAHRGDQIFDIWSLVVDLRRCVDTSSSAQLAGLDVAAAQCGTGGFILDACGPDRPVLAACRACEAWLRELAGRESSHREDTRAGVKYRGFFLESSNFALRRSFGTQRDLSCYREHSADTVRCVSPGLSDRPTGRAAAAAWQAARARIARTHARG